MATSDQFKYSTDGSVKSKYVCCSPCSDDGSYTQSRHYCVDCEMYFCTKCVKCHNKITASKPHHVNDVDTSDTTYVDNEDEERRTESSDTLKCTLHQDKLMDTYCKNHDNVCCGTCAIVKHRLCTTESTATAAKNFKSNPEVIKSKESLTNFLFRLKQEKEKRTENLDYIGKQKLELTESVDKYEEKIIAKIKELANITRKEIRSKYEKYKTALDKDVSALCAVMTATTVYVDKLEQTGDELLLFTNVKTSKIVTRDGEMFLEAMETEWKEREIKLHFDKTLEHTADEMKSLGRLEGECVVKEYKATFQTNVSVTKNGIDTTVADMCIIDSNDLLLTDYNYTKLKRFNSDLRYKDEIHLSGMPTAVCTIDKHEVAVRIWYSRVVHIVSIAQTMQLKSSFTLADNGWGMTYDAGTGEIFACEENKVSVYSKTGHKLRTYDKDTNGEQMFTRCRQIALSMNKQDIYVTDEAKGLIVLDKSGTLKMKVALTGVSDIWSLCLLPGHICLTGGRTSDVIVQIDKDGKQAGNLIDSKDGRTYTYCAVYDCEHSRLIVGGHPSVISIYTISAK